jgi:hypothetical protein
VQTFCHLLLHYTGCRIGEAPELTPDRVDLAGRDRLWVLEKAA